MRGIEEEDWEKIEQVVMEVHDREGGGERGRKERVREEMERRGFRVEVESRREAGRDGPVQPVCGKRRRGEGRARGRDKGGERGRGGGRRERGKRGGDKEVCEGASAGVHGAGSDSEAGGDAADEEWKS